jgi:hypothetical protein
MAADDLQPPERRFKVWAMRPAHLSLLFLASILPAASALADPRAELSSFSVFNNIDLAQLAKSDAKTAHGPPTNNPRFLSVQSCYIAPGSPPQQLEALRRWNPLQHRELKVFLHTDLGGSPGEAAFAKLKNVPDNAAVRAFVNATLKMSNDLHLSREEAAKFNATGASGGIAGAVGDFWINVLAGRARAFASGGSSALPPYDHGGRSVRVADEQNGLLREQPKIRKQFAGFLESTGIGRGAGSIRPDLYWQLNEVEDVGVVTLGAFYGRSSASSAQAADTSYYASSGYYTGVTLYQMWPVDVNGQASTLVWRGDMISAASLESLRGVEKLGSESAMMKDVARAIRFFRQDTAR